MWNGAARGPDQAMALPACLLAMPACAWAYSSGVWRRGKVVG